MSYFKVLAKVFKKNYFKLLSALVCVLVALSIGLMFNMKPTTITEPIAPPVTPEQDNTSFVEEPEVWSDNQTAFAYERLFNGDEFVGWVITGFETGAVLQTSYINFPQERSSGKVVGVKAGAFKNNTRIKGVKIPETYLTIGESAFEKCTNLKIVNLGVDINDVDACELVVDINAFKNCNKVVFVTLSCGVKAVNDNAFLNCENIADIQIFSRSAYSAIDGKNSVGGLLKNCSTFLTGDGADDGTNSYVNKFYTNKEVNIDGNFYAEYYLISDLYVATLNADGGSCGVENIEFMHGVNSTDELPVPTKQHFVFIDWAYVDNGETIKVKNLSEVNRNVELKAIWSPVFYNINYYKDLDGQITEVGSTTKYHVTDENKPSSEFGSLSDVNGYEFVGWYLKDSQGNYLPDAVDELVCANGGDVELYARYIKLFNIENGVVVGYYGDGWSIRNVVISNNMYDNTVITGIGEGAFEGVTSLRNVTVNCNVTYIGANAFKNASRLRTIEFNEETCNISTIGDNAFYGCESLESIIIPKTVSMLGVSAFEGCSSLERVTFNGEYVTSIANRTFYNCNSLLYLKLCSTIYSIGDQAFYNNSRLSSNKNNIYTNIYAVLTKLKTIGKSAFEGCANLKDFKFYGDIEDVGENAFKGCKALSTVEFDELCALTEIKTYVFEGCASLTNIAIPNTVEVVGDYAFSNCTKLKNVAIGSALEVIGRGAFVNCSALETAVAGDALVSIGPYAFKNTKLTVFTLGKSIETVGKGAFENCTKLSQVFISDVNGWWASSSDDIQLVPSNELYFRLSSEIAEWFKTNTTKNVCYYKTFVTESGVVTGLTDEGRNLSCLYVGATISEIGSGVLSQMQNLQAIEFADINGWHQNVDGELFVLDILPAQGASDLQLKNQTNILVKAEVFLFEGDVIVGLTDIGKTLQKIVVPDGIVEIASGAFKNSVNLREINICYSVEKIGARAFEGSGVQTINFADLHYWNRVNVLTEGSVDAEFTEANIVQKLVSQFEFEYVRTTLFRIEGTTVIGATDALRDYDGVLYIPEIAEKISDSAFYVDDSKFNEYYGGSYKGYEGWAFTKVVIGSNLVEIGKYAFYQCREVVELDLTNATSLTTVRDYAFYNCKKIADIVGGFNNVSKIGQSAFSGCEALTTITLTEKIKSIGAQAFIGCYSLETLIVNATANILADEYLFAYCVNLQTVTLSSAIKTLGLACFSDCEKLISINLQYVERIEDYALYGCWSLQEVVLSSSLVSIGESAFMNCSKIERVLIPASVNTIKRCAFVGCDKLNIVEFADVNNWQIYDEYSSRPAIIYAVGKFSVEYTSVNAQRFRNSDVDYSYVSYTLKKV